MQNGKNRLENESESSLKIIKLLSVQQINAGQINASTEKFITVNETSKSKENKLNHQQDNRIPPDNSFETLSNEKSQDKPESTDKEVSILSLFDHATSK